MSPYNYEIKSQPIEISLESVFINEVENSSKVECAKDKSYICSSSFDGFFGHDIIEVPLPFDDAEGMLHNSLSPAVSFFVGLYSLLVLKDQIGIF